MFTHRILYTCNFFGTSVPCSSCIACQCSNLDSSKMNKNYEDRCTDNLSSKIGSIRKGGLLVNKATKIDFSLEKSVVMRYKRTRPMSRTDWATYEKCLSDSLNLLTGWLCDWLTDWLTVCLTDWRTDCLTHWLTDWLTDLLTYWLTD